MTRMPRMNGGGGTGRVLSLHQQGGGYRLVVAEGRGGAISVLSARSVREGELASALAAAVREHKPERLVRVVPGNLSVCRCVEVPEGDAASLEGALSLLAEAQLPENLPGHRRAAGLIPGRCSDGSRLALLTACRDGAKPLDAETPEFWVAEIAALALLRGGEGTAVYADRETGAIAIVAEGPRRTVARILVEDGESASAWGAAVRAAVSETSSAAGAERGPAVAAGDVMLELPASATAGLRERVSGARDDRAWLGEYGIALGGAMIALDTDPLVSSLASMTPDGRVVRDPAWERAARWLGRPRNAWGVVAACLALLLLGPLAVAGARLAILQAKSGALEAGRQERAEMDRRGALYAQLEQVRWPMTKLMADVAGATPVGVVVSDFRVGNDMGLSVNGSAETLDQLYTFQRNLANSRIFREVKVNRSEFVGERVEFDLAADVMSPHTVVKPAEDFAEKTLAVRLYGEGASNTATPIAMKKEQAATRTVSATRPASRTGRSEEPEERGSGGDEAESSRRPTTTATANAPAPITDEQIKALDRGKANLEWAMRKGAAARASDEAVKARLLEEVRKLDEHRKEAK